MSGDVSTTETLLLDIFQQIGRVEGQNEMIIAEQARAADGRRGLYDAVDKMRVDVAATAQNTAAVVARVTALEPNVTKLTAFRSQVSIAVVFVTAIVTGAFNLVWFGFTHINEAREALRGFLK